MSEEIWSSRIEDGKQVLSIKPSLIANPIGKLTTSYEIVDGVNLRTKNIFTGVTRVTKIANISSIEIENPSVAKRLVGFGTLVFFATGTGEDSRLKWDRVPHPQKVRDFIFLLRDQNSHKPQSASPAAQGGTQQGHKVVSQKLTAARVGPKIVLVPRLSKVLEEPLFRCTATELGIPDAEFEPRSRVDRGQSMWSFPIRTSNGRDAIQNAKVRSPVSGILFSDSGRHLFDQRSQGDFCLAILVDDDEPYPLPPQAVFRELTKLLEDHGDFIIGDYWRANGKEGSWQDVLNSEIRRLNTSKCITFDLKNEYAEFIKAWGWDHKTAEEIIRFYQSDDSELRDHIGFLDDVLSFHSEGVSRPIGVRTVPPSQVSKGASTWDTRTDTGSPKPLVLDGEMKSSANQDFQAALQRFELPESYTREELAEKYGYWKETLPAAMLAQLRLDHEVLLAKVS